VTSACPDAIACALAHFNYEGITMINRDDFLIKRDQILDALKRLGELAKADGLEIKLGLIGGAVMVLEYGVREFTHDVDAIILAPAQTWKVFELVRIVAKEKGWPDDWLNDDAGQFVPKLRTHRLFTAPGIEAYAPATAQMLALKLSASRGKVDISDAANLLKRLSGTREEIWRAVKPSLVRGCEATAGDAFDYIWSDTHGHRSIN
jgi:Nucleotidyl transferase of unknown function (DUF2204)